MNYAETLKFLYDSLPMFQRLGAAAYKTNLNNTQKIARLLNFPEKDFNSIHVAGTNGKGSVSHLLASVLQEAGYKTGLFTSPHLKDFRERIRINGKKIEKKFIVEFVSNYQKVFAEISPSFFEYTFALASYYFAGMKADIAVIETGMGGRLDSTNIITPDVSVITNIGLDHTRFLGNSIKKIAHEKAGIIKPGIPVVIGESQQDIKNIFVNTAKKNASEIFFADKDLSIRNIKRVSGANPYIQFDVFEKGSLLFEGINCPLSGEYQI
ncbi:MAG: bifunctional folylpolyglutamate synthase/dihydrofolate synthase, partial [Bacteroidales bacterium]|nr:bifunctional folylpolyglutamate synthase/dihydrofolate synthase [Bacteroidales bacterium]